MEGSKKGQKPVKFPKALFSSWNKLFDLYERTNQDMEPIPAVVSLKQLLRSEDATYERQAAYIKETAKLMQKTASSVDNLQPAELKQLKYLVEPIVSLGYFAATENLSRRNFIPVIDAVIKCIGNDNTMFNKLYLDYLSEEPMEPSFESKPLSEKALTVYATLKFTFGQETVSQHYKKTLVFFFKGLQKAQQQLSSTMIANTNQVMNDIEFTLKSFLVLFSRQMSVAIKLFKVVEQNQKDDKDAILLKDIINNLLDICVDTNKYVKECNQVAGMVIGTIMNLAANPQFTRDWILGWFFTTGESNAATKQMNNIFDINSSTDKRFNIENNWNTRDAPMIFILRGLVSSLRKDIVMLECPSTLSLVALIQNLGAKNLHDLLFNSIDLFCGRADLDPTCKVIAFEAMATWLQQTIEIMRSCDDESSINTVSNKLQLNQLMILVQYVCDHWEDPIDSIQHKVRSIFELSITAYETKTKFFNQSTDYNNFISVLLKYLLAIDWHRKAKYSLLNMLVEKAETDRFLEAEPKIIQKCLLAMDSLVLCPQITFFILQFLYRRIQDKIPGYAKFKGHNGKFKDINEKNVESAIDEWSDLWITSVLEGLMASSELLRKNVSRFLLQPLFKIGSQPFWRTVHILEDAKHPIWTEQQLNAVYRLNAFIAILKAGRTLDYVDGHSYQYGTVAGRRISIDTLKLAIYHSDPQVRLDVLGLLCESRKAIAEISDLEFELLRLFLPLNMNSTIPEFRQQLGAYMTKLLTRLRANLYSQYRNYKALLSHADKQADSSRRDHDLKDAERIMSSINASKSFLEWLLDHLSQSLYPGASYQRISTALRLVSIIIKTFGVSELPSIEGFKDQQPDFPFKLNIATPEIVKLLIDILLNPYDFNRVQAYDILCQLPSPLSGIESKRDVQDLLWWGLSKVVSTRAGESDSGALIFRLIFNKYVMGLGFDLHPEEHAAVVNSTVHSDVSKACLIFTERLLNLLERQVTIAKTNLLLAAQQHPIHGTLLALQYVFQELDYENEHIRNNLNAWRKVHTRVLELMHVTCETTVPIISDASPEGNVPSDYRGDGDEEDEEIDIADDDKQGPKHQVILSCCWRAVKEVSSLLKVFISKAPATTAYNEKASRVAVLTYDDLIKCGDLLRHLLTNIRHRGAFSAVYPAYVSLNTRLLTCGDTDLVQLPAQWLQENLDSLTSSNISITRRSAGLPLCILAIVSSESSVKRELLNRAMNYLMQLAREIPPENADQRIDLPQVHAYNIMRSIFMDSKLGSYVLEYASKGFSLAIGGFSSRSWAIRNCSVMLFSTLLQRTFGTKKIRDEHSHVNTLTGREFFVRFPDLHPYLIKQLEIAVEQLLNNSLAASVHPGLYPILTLLSRMQPSSFDLEEEESVLNPFIPLVSACAASAIYKTREMAARALVPLVSNVTPTLEKLFDIPEQSTQNEIHGRLLQVQFLLRGHFSTSNSSINVLIQFVKALPVMVEKIINRLKGGYLCNMNSALLLNILNEFAFGTEWINSGQEDDKLKLELIQLSDTVLIDLRATLKALCTDAIRSNQISGFGSYLFRESIANIIITTTLNDTKVNLDTMLFLLADKDYEVRLTTVQRLTAFIQHNVSEEIEITGKKDLQATLLQRIYSGEDNLNCFVATANLLIYLNSKEPYPSDMDLPFTLEQYWDRLVEQFESKSALSVTESVLPLLGALLTQILHTYNTHQTWVKTCLTLWSGYIAKYSQSHVTLPLREAVVKSLQYSADNLFAGNEEENDFKDSNAANARINALLTIIRLLQDDDADVRDDVAFIVSKALGLEAPVHHERALEVVHKYLTNRFADSEFLKAICAKHLADEASLGELHRHMNNTRT
ncbi:putative death-receptor fusion protein-domain-containing protein [Mycotypha africana]|uniref:putative death-receptor fusion protein-domain-containing protein n=1 Tax=Mycotypha africana TaxID=64632 RepID=UPI00230006E5|nr:putative death-receptor fusion protein-domain-containing protein [Mycotypha africana]KAI8979250.1 putative death-receptor fusion protein-domain-containing protein [Mycotypha africana]